MAHAARSKSATPQRRPAVGTTRIPPNRKDQLSRHHPRQQITRWLRVLGHQGRQALLHEVQDRTYPRRSQGTPLKKALTSPATSSLGQPCLLRLELRRGVRPGLPVQPARSDRSDHLQPVDEEISQEPHAYLQAEHQRPLRNGQALPGGLCPRQASPREGEQANRSCFR